MHVDLYQGGPYIPFYLVTQEFFRLVRAHMTGDGLLMMNVFDPGPRAELLSAIGGTLQTVFPSVMLTQATSGNYMVLAFSSPTTKATVLRELEAAPRCVAGRAAAALREFHARPGSPIFSDDHAAVEQMTKAAVAARGL